MKTLLMKILESNFLFPSLLLCWTFIHKVAKPNQKKGFNFLLLQSTP